MCGYSGLNSQETNKQSSSTPNSWCFIIVTCTCTYTHMHILCLCVCIYNLPSLFCFCSNISVQYWPLGIGQLIYQLFFPSLSSYWPPVAFCIGMGPCVISPVYISMTTHCASIVQVTVSLRVMGAFSLSCPGAMNSWFPGPSALDNLSALFPSIFPESYM